MAVEIRMPQLGLTMTEGTVGAWLKQVGDVVAKGEPILEITTDKLTSEIESETDGVLLAIIAQEYDDVPVQGILGYIGQPGEQVPTVASADMADAASAADSASAAASEAVGTLVPEVGAQIPAIAPAAGQVAAPGSGALASSEGAIAPAAGSRIKISPLAKKTADKLGVDFGSVWGTGPAGRILQRDILKEQERLSQTPQTAGTAAIQPVAAATATGAQSGAVTAPGAVPIQLSVAAAAATGFSGQLTLMEGDTVVKLTGMRKVVSERMSQSRREIPSVTQNVKIDVTALMEFRQELNANRETRFSVNDFVLKAVAKALRQNPHMLVSLEGDQVIKRAHVNLGMAVAVDDGLIVPVIRDADRLSLEALAEAAKDLAARARDGRLQMDEYKGSTFSLSNLGMFGVETFDPIINQPDAAILGVCAITPELAYDDIGDIYEKQTMRISLTFDHRLIDGATAAKFELAVKGLLEDPMSIIL